MKTHRKFSWFVPEGLQWQVRRQGRKERNVALQCQIGLLLACLYLGNTS